MVDAAPCGLIAPGGDTRSPLFCSMTSRKAARSGIFAGGGGGMLGSRLWIGACLVKEARFFGKAEVLSFSSVFDKIDVRPLSAIGAFPSLFCTGAFELRASLWGMRDSLCSGAFETRGLLRNASYSRSARLVPELPGGAFESVARCRGPIEERSFFEDLSDRSGLSSGDTSASDLLDVVILYCDVICTPFHVAQTPIQIGPVIPHNGGRKEVSVKYCNEIEYLHLT